MEANVSQLERRVVGWKRGWQWVIGVPGLSYDIPNYFMAINLINFHIIAPQFIS